MTIMDTDDGRPQSNLTCQGALLLCLLRCEMLRKRPSAKTSLGKFSSLLITCLSAQTASSCIWNTARNTRPSSFSPLALYMGEHTVHTSHWSVECVAFGGVLANALHL